MAVVNKPPSIPVHPSGPHARQSLTMLLEGVGGIGGLHPVHRLDRPTGGLVLMGRCKAAARELTQLLATVEAGLNRDSESKTALFGDSSDTDGAGISSRSTDASGSANAGALHCRPGPSGSSDALGTGTDTDTNRPAGGTIDLGDDRIVESGTRILPSASRLPQPPRSPPPPPPPQPPTVPDPPVPRLSKKQRRLAAQRQAKARK